MKISIRTKLIILGMFIPFIVICLFVYSLVISQMTFLESLGKNSIYVADLMLQRIDKGIYTKIIELRENSLNPIYQSILRASNKSYEDMETREQFITIHDKEWCQAFSGMSPSYMFMTSIRENELSQYLTKIFKDQYIKEYGSRIFIRVLLTNKYGVNIALTDITSDFYQGDKEWWQVAKKNTFYISDIIYDEITGINCIIISVRIDDNNGSFAGVLCGIIDINTIIREIEMTTKRIETARIRILSSDGKLIYSTKTFKSLEDLSKEDFYKETQNRDGFQILEINGEEKLISYVHSQGYGSFGGTGWMLIIEYDREKVLEPILSLNLSILLFSIILLVLSILFSVQIFRSIMKPLAKLKNGAAIIGRGNLSYKIAYSGNDELGSLSKEFNIMTKNLKLSHNKLKAENVERKKAEERLKKSQAQLIQAEKLSAMGTLTAGVAHEMNNPLMSILNYIQYCEKHLNSASKEYNILKDAEQEVDKCIAIIKNLLTFSRMEEEGEEAFRSEYLLKIVERVLKLLSYKISLNNIKIALAIPDKGLTMRMKANSIQQVLLNLIVNAIDAVAEKKEREISISAKRENHRIQLTIADNGCGIPQDKIPYIFDPFFTTKKTGEGTGLGLSICQSIITAHKGTISCSSKKGEGTKFDIIFQLY